MHLNAPDIGSTVGPWLILEWVDSGSFGIVYRAERVGHPHSPPVAVKMARNPYDPRFQREAVLLQQLSHPSIPRFGDLGVWVGPENRRYSYISTPSAAGTEEGEPPSEASSDDEEDGDEEVVSARGLAMPTWLTWMGASALGGLITSLVMLMVRPSAPEPAPNPTPWLATPEEVAQFAPDAGVSEEALASVENTLPQTGPLVASFGRSMPPKPYPTQRRPPCERGEQEINGGCWVGPIEAEKPPCGDKMFDHEGRCYFVSFKEAHQPTSGEP